MISLTYLSTAKVAFSDSELEELLEGSRDRNHAAGLSGVLLYAGGHFIQTLEGPEEAVDAFFARINRDERHRSIIVALREEIDTRSFPDWSMGFETLDDQTAAELPGFNTYMNDGRVAIEDGQNLGRSGIFHRVFRNNMR